MNLKVNMMTLNRIGCILFLYSSNCLAELMAASGEGNSCISEKFDHNKSLSESFQRYMEFGLEFAPASLFVDKYATILLYIIGFPGNVISFLVWANKRMYKGNSAAVYLAALSVNDVIVLGFALYRDLSRNWGFYIYMTPGSCEVTRTLEATTQYSAPLYVLAFTVERWLAICHPFKVSQICSVKRAVYICISIVTLTLIVCFPHAFIMHTDVGFCSAPPETVYYSLSLEIIFSVCAPLLVLTFNCLVISELAKIRRTRCNDFPNVSFSNKEKDKVLRPHSSKKEVDKMKGLNKPESVDSMPIQPLMNSSKTVVEENSELNSKCLTLKYKIERKKSCHLSSDFKQKSPKFRSTTIMLLVVSFYCMLTTLLGGIIYILEQRYSIDNLAILPIREFCEHPTVKLYQLLKLPSSLGNEIALSHYAAGFLLYYASGRNFRQMVHLLLWKLTCNRTGTASRRERNFSPTFPRRNVGLTSSIRESSTTSQLHGQARRRANSSVEGRRFVWRPCMSDIKSSFRRRNTTDKYLGLEDCGRKSSRKRSNLTNHSTSIPDAL